MFVFSLKNNNLFTIIYIEQICAYSSLNGSLIFKIPACDTCVILGGKY